MKSIVFVSGVAASLLALGVPVAHADIPPPDVAPCGSAGIGWSSPGTPCTIAEGGGGGICIAASCPYYNPFDGGTSSYACARCEVDARAPDATLADTGTGNNDDASTGSADATSTATDATGTLADGPSTLADGPSTSADGWSGPPDSGALESGIADAGAPDASLADAGTGSNEDASTASADASNAATDGASAAADSGILDAGVATGPASSGGSGCNCTVASYGTFRTLAGWACAAAFMLLLARRRPVNRK
jgi:hypothetical protein